MEDLHVTLVDNRGNAECPFGYVYFSDATRVAFADFRSSDGALEFAPGWGVTGPEHTVLATDAISDLRI